MTLFIAGVTLEEVREATVSALFVKLEQERKALYLGAGSEDSLNLCKSTLGGVQEDYPLDDVEKDYLKDLLQFWLSGLFLGDGFEGEIPDSSEDLRRTATTAFTYTAAIHHYCCRLLVSTRSGWVWWSLLVTTVTGGMSIYLNLLIVLYTNTLRDNSAQLCWSRAS